MEVILTDERGRTRTFQPVLDEKKLPEKDAARLVSVGRGGDRVNALETTPPLQRIENFIRGFVPPLGKER